MLECVKGSSQPGAEWVIQKEVLLYCWEGQRLPPANSTDTHSSGGEEPVNLSCHKQCWQDIDLMRAISWRLGVGWGWCAQALHAGVMTGGLMHCALIVQGIGLVIKRPIGTGNKELSNSSHLSQKLPRHLLTFSQPHCCPQPPRH